MSFEIFKSQDGLFRFRLLIDNNVVLTSERYTNKANCKNGINSVKNNGLYKDAYDYQETVKGRFYFNIKARNGQIVASSTYFDLQEESLNLAKFLQKSLMDIEIG